MKSALVVLAALALVGPADAGPYITDDDRAIPIEYWAGEGANQAAVVVDFGSGPDDSFAFGYRWSGSATGEHALLAIDDAGDLEVTLEYFDFDNDGVPDGAFVDAMAYDGHVWENNWDPPHEDWWSYWTDDFGEAETPDDLLDEGLSWHSPIVGLSERVLADRSFDGWSAAIGWEGTPPELPAGVEVIPEPTSLVLLAVGLCALGVRRRR